MTITLAAMCLPTDNAVEVAKLLLKLGATSAQADTDHFTLLHTLAAINAGDILDVIFKYDRPAALGVLNCVGYSGTGEEYDTPLSAAINRRHDDIASQFLKQGAKPVIDFDDWIKFYLVKHPTQKNMAPEQAQTLFKKSVTQPLVAATIQEMGATVKNLIAHGADPCALDRRSHVLLEQRYNRFSSREGGSAVLDIVRNALSPLKQYDGQYEKFWWRRREVPDDLYDEAYYTRGLIPETYQFWTAFHDYHDTKQRNNTKLPKDAHDLEIDEGIKIKKKAVQNLTRELESIEKILVDAGAKTFKELHPDFVKSGTNNTPTIQKEARKPYNTVFSFLLPDLDDTKKARYIKMFEAAWSNDVETVKEISLGSSPLQIAVKDEKGFSPFSLAVLRGHYDLARAIVQICQAQYSDTSQRQIWNILETESDDGESDDAEDGNNALRIFSQLVTDEFTIDNLVDASANVKSDVSPKQLINWPALVNRFDDEKRGRTHFVSLLEYAVDSNNVALVRFILQLEQEVLSTDQVVNSNYDVRSAAFNKAISLGRTSILTDIIQKTGHGIPFDSLAKTSGIEIKEKPKYYQGLTVGGKKRADWAKRPGGT